MPYPYIIINHIYCQRRYSNSSNPYAMNKQRTIKENIASIYSPHTAKIADVEFAEADSISALHDVKKSKSENTNKYLIFPIL